MTGQHDLHLTEEQIDDFLMESPETGPGSTAAQHLALCLACQSLLADQRQLLTDAVGAFDQASLRWAQARANSLPLALPPRPRLFGIPAWSVAGALALLLGVAVQGRTHQPATFAAPAQATLANDSTPQAPSEIAEDNDLLDSIGQAIDAPVVSPAKLFRAPTSNTNRQVAN